MARNDGVDRTTVRTQPRTESNIADAEAHNERQKACYRNEDIVPERSHLNIHFKEPSGSYQDMFRQMEQDGTISTRGLKQDAVHYGELVFDVNSAYFHNHGGYEFAQAFYAEAYRAAVDIVGGERYILSAVMHADERNQGMSKALGNDVWHYHLHVVYVPVVEKQILWSKRCKDPALVGTVKETIMQVSHSKKWQSQPVLDEFGEPLRTKTGKIVLKKSYHRCRAALSPICHPYIRSVFRYGDRAARLGFQRDPPHRSKHYHRLAVFAGLCEGILSGLPGD